MNMDRTALDLWRGLRLSPFELVGSDLTRVWTPFAEMKWPAWYHEQDVAL
jgi:hypothetical protein